MIPLGVMTGSFMSSKLICPHKKSGTSLFCKKPGKNISEVEVGFLAFKVQIKVTVKHNHGLTSENCIWTSHGKSWFTVSQPWFKFW